MIGKEIPLFWMVSLSSNVNTDLKYSFKVLAFSAGTEVDEKVARRVIEAE